jgi:hypothetical protein
MDKKMKLLIKKLTIIEIAVFIALPPSWSGEFDYASYTQTTLQNIIAEEQKYSEEQVADKKHTDTELVLLDCRVAKYRVSCRYSNVLRPVSEKKKSVIIGWMEMLAFDTKSASLYKQEMRVSEGTSVQWIPIQEQLFPHLTRELVKNDTIDLFVIFIGKVESELVFIGTEFAKPDASTIDSLNTTAALRAEH